MVNKKLFIKENGVRFRKSPGIIEGAKLLLQGKEVEFIDGPWLKVKLDNEEGWVHGDYLVEANPNPIQVIQQVIKFIKGQVNLASSEITETIRKIIGDEFGGGKNNWQLQCTEYVQYRVKTKLNIDIKWPIKSGRHGGKWIEIFQKFKLYKILDEPQINCAVCFTDVRKKDGTPTEEGHVAFVEEVLSNGLINISEANWPSDGIYNERLINKNDWQNKYKAKFIQFI